uniref:Leukemia inhibitory factor receptor n=1 Tax=Sphenodon punctatus TaxID=8508 RepID=A0A8D0L5J1_SPHPU
EGESDFLKCLLYMRHCYNVNIVISGSPETPQNLRCITHDLNILICSWNVASLSNHGLTYEFCHASGCVRTEDKKANVPLVLFQDTTIRITTLNASENLATKTFVLTEQNVSLVPPTPRILSLTPDFKTSLLHLKWNDSGSVWPYEADARWQIEVLRKNTLETVIYHSKLTLKDTVLSWDWKSDMPLECISHYVKIRCYIDEQMFLGKKEWSEWSPLKMIPGKDSDPDVVQVFPDETTVVVGSNVTFCCVCKEGDRVKNLAYGSKTYPLIRLSNRSTAIQVPNVGVSISSGTNIVCYPEINTLFGTVVFVGYPPDSPQNLSCETLNFSEIICSWDTGQPTKLLQKTVYILSERISGINVTCKEERTAKINHCVFPVIGNQKIYNFTVKASNPLGQPESSLLIDVNQRVHPEAPSEFTVRDLSPTNVSLSWYLCGNFTEIRLLCQIEVNSINSEAKSYNVSLDGAENSFYYTSVENLHPYTTYAYRARCAASEHFWKWSKWSETKHYRTLEASPSRAPDIWRVRSADGESLEVFWKPLPLSDTNGVIQYHEVFWSLPEKNVSSVEVPVWKNSTKIKLGKNNYIISVVAKNRAGFSPPSTITSVELPNDGVKTEHGIATGDGIYISWYSDPNVTCGYTVQWCCSSKSEFCSVNWETFSSNMTAAVIKSALFQPGVRYSFSLYGCKHDGYQLLQYINGYVKELAPKVAPNFTVEHTTSDSILVKWEDMPVEDCQGFLMGYLLFFAKEEEGTLKPRSSETGHLEQKVKNITDLTKKSLTILDLQGKTSYRLDLQAYTIGGKGPQKGIYVVTKDDSLGLIIAILVPVAVAIVLGVVTSIFCYRKREWIKETFYPDIPNPENSKALQFQKTLCEGNAALKTLEMNPCTPNSVEVLETQLSFPKIEDTEIMSPAADELPEDGSDIETENHVVVSYCPPIIEEEEISNPPLDEPVGSSQVVYIDIQSMYQPQVKPEEEPEVDCVSSAGYKPQMQLPVSALKIENQSTAAEDLDKTAGYRPQANTQAWNLDSPDSPGSITSNNENGSFGSPCSINSRQFLIPPKDDEDSPKPNNIGWSFTNFFQNKPND